jgi:putative ABC transport system permease protein
MSLTNLFLAIRQLKSNKVFSIINIVGLAFSMVACLLIYKYVTFEKSYDDYHEGVENVYRLYRYSENAKDFAGVASVFPMIAPTTKSNIPDIVKAARVIGSEKIFQSFGFSYHDQDIVRTFNIEKSYYADSDALDIFSLEWVDNDGQPSLDNPNELVLAESYAKRFFGDERAVGKVLRFKNMKQDYLVTGVFKDLPENTHFKFNLLGSIGSLPKEWNLDTDDGWGNFYTYFKLTDGADPLIVQQKVEAFLNTKAPWYQEEGLKFPLQSIDEIHLESNLAFELETNGNKKAVNFLSIIGIFIMVVAWVNYINLSTSKLVDRAREVGVRKVLGSHKRQLIGQFLVESLVVNFIALGLALTILQLTIGFFQTLLGIPIVFLSGEALVTTLLFIGLFSMGSMLFGLYPAMLFSSLKITQVLKGKSKSTKSGLLLRKGLTVFQFVIALLLIVGTVSVYMQLEFMGNQSLGMNIEQTVVVKKPYTGSESRVESHRSFVNGISQISNVNGITSSSEVPGNVITRMRGVRLLADENSHGIYAKDISIDEHFLDIYEIKLLHGATFSQVVQKNSFMLNESAAKALFGNEDLSAKINQTYYYLNKPSKLIGIIADFSQESLKTNTEAHIYSANARIRFYSIKVSGDNISESLKSMEAKFDNSFPESHFEYFFMDEFFNRQYKADRLFGKIFTFFSILAVVITALGLFGLALYNVSQRSKEISIRKVLGASMQRISLLLCKEYFILLTLASLVSIPLGYYMVDQWLSSFANRMPIQAIIFISPIITILIITLISVGYQVIKAALSNPADTLRYE